MKKKIFLILLVFISLLIVGCGKNEDTESQSKANDILNNEKEEINNDNKVLVVYFSRTGRKINHYHR